MRNIPSALNTHIQGEVLALSRCIKITRGDGVIVRITNHDTDIIVNGDRYMSDVPMDISALENTDSLSVDNADLTLGIDGDIITLDDLDAGLYDNADFEMFIVNWESPGDGIIPLKRGTLGDVEIDNGISAKIQLRGLTYLLQRPIVEKYSLTCRVALGSKRCGVVNSPIRLRRDNQRVKTWDWFLVPAANVTPISLANASFETDLSGWTIPDGSAWSRNNTFAAFSGSYYVEGGAGTVGQDLVMYQDITTATLGMADVDVDDGSLSVDFSSQIARSVSATENPGKLYIEQYDSLGRTIKRDETDWIVADYQVWQGVGITAFVIPGCRTIRFGVINHIDEGAAGGVAFDAFSARYFTNEASTWGGAQFRTVKLPSYQTDELFNLQNGSFDAQPPVGNTAVTTAITGWTIAASSFWQTAASVGSLVPQDGAAFLFGGNNASGTGSQEYTISQTKTLAQGGALASAALAQNITDGWYFFETKFRLARTDTDASGRVIVEFIGSSGTIATVDSGYITPASANVWEAHSLASRVPSGTTSVKVSLMAKSGAAGSQANIGFDNVSSYMVPVAYEHPNDPELANIAETAPTYDYTTNNFTLDGDAIVQARAPVFNYGSVDSVSSSRIFSSSDIDLDPSVFYSGRITWLSGQNAGKISYVRIYDNGTKTVKLYAELKKPISVGDKFVFAKGCDKTIDTCADVFGNAHNFRGEPYLPGPSKVVEYLTQTTVET